jgi:transaldolase
MTDTVSPVRPQEAPQARQRTEPEVPSLSRLQVRIFADGADQAGMLEMYSKPYIAGFTTNPTLMRKAGVANYRAFARDILRTIHDRPIAFEVFSDDFSEMERQAYEIASWGENVYVKIPITNTNRQSAQGLVRRLTGAGIKLNITALLTVDQVRKTVESVAGGGPCFISVFAGRIADTGRDPVPTMVSALDLLKQAPNAELIWASPREVLNIIQADEIGCHIITVTNDLLKKLVSIGKGLDDFSLETVRMFYNDARQAGYSL